MKDKRRPAHHPLPFALRPSPFAFSPLLVGVSGGMDSAALLDALVRQGVAVEVAHVHYGLRGPDSDADAALVAETCAALGVALHLHRVGPADVPPANRQAWARAVRYRFFADVAAARGLSAVATAHHADDQAETVLLALLRGGRLAALRGMRPSRPLDPLRAPGVVLVRPLLHIPRAEIRAYALAHGLAWRDDASNADRRYRRNALRHDLLPRLEAHAPGTTARLAAAADVADRLCQHDERRRRALLDAAVSDDGRVRLAPLADLPDDDRAGVWTEALRRFLPGVPPERGRRRALDGLAAAQVGRRVVWAEGTVWRERDALRFIPADLPTADAATLWPGATAAFGAHRFAAEGVAPCPEALPDDPSVALLRADAFPLTLRAWRPGERLAVLGGAAAPRIAGLLTRAHIPASERAAWPVVAGAGGEALWLPGVRLGRGAAARPGEASVRVVHSPPPGP